MKLLVTGGAGFIGSSVVRLAIARGYRVINVDALTYAGRLENLKDVAHNENYHFEQVDIRDRQSLDRILKHHQPDAVMHLAAESHVDRSIQGPETFIDTNVVGTAVMLEASRKYWQDQGHPNRFIFHHVSTDEVYGSLPDDPTIRFSEQTRYDPRSPYSASKASSDHLVRAWHETYGLPIVISNCSNNYGPYQFPEKLIPLVVLNSIAGKEIPIYGNGRNIRDWLYVEDHVEALFLVLEKGEIGRSYNIGGQNEMCNLDLVNIICSELDLIRPRSSGKYAELIQFVPDRPGHDARYAIDPNRIRKELSWKPTVSIEEGLRATINWYLDNQWWWKSLITN